jgi:hypothetical protein
MVPVTPCTALYMARLFCGEVPEVSSYQLLPPSIEARITPESGVPSMKPATYKLLASSNATALLL